MKLLLFVILSSLLFSCGVKAPPLAPEVETAPEPTASNSPSPKN